MPTYRKSGLAVSVFKFQASGTPDYAGDLENATMTIEVPDEDGAGINDQWDFAWAVGQRWQLECECFTGGSTQSASNAFLATLAGTSVALTWNSGANTYAGNALVTMASHTSSKRTLQKQKATLKGQGALTITVPT